MLSRREHACAQLASALRERGFEGALVDSLVAELREERLLDDARYALQLVRSRAERGQGPRRIRLELAAAGVDEALISQALDGAPDFHAIAAGLRRRRFGVEPPADWTERARQSRFLQYRGFSNDHIASAFGSSGGSDTDFPELSADDDP